MRAKAARATLTALACLLVCLPALEARPNRTIPRPASRESIVRLNPRAGSHSIRIVPRDTRTTARSARDPFHQLEVAPTSTRNRSSMMLRPAREASDAARYNIALGHPGKQAQIREQAALAVADPAVVRRVHAWEQTQRDLAARAAILAADLSTGQEQAANAPVSRAVPPSPQTAPARAARFEDQPTTDPQFAADDPHALTNAGGVLQTASDIPSAESIEEEASTPVLLPSFRVESLYDSRGRLILPPPLYGSREILLHQNEMADRDGLGRVRDDADLLELRRQKKLVALPESEALRIDYRLPENRRFSRPWTAAFLAVLARDYYASFHAPLQVDSAVRTVQFQQQLIRTNGNAAPASGDTASPHLTGQAVDIAKSSLSLTEIAWMRAYLQPLIDQGKIDVEEEFQQACFHISVYRNYLVALPPHLAVAAGRQTDTEPLP
jgi:hypothetical protein